MISSITAIILAAAPSAPAPTCPCEITDWRCRSENPICKEIQTVPTAPAPTVQQTPAPATDPEVTDPKPPTRGKYSSFLANGGYIVANVGGVARHDSDFGYLWGFDGGGWFAIEKPLSLGIGFRFENQPGFELWRFGIPIRLSINSDYFSFYGVFTPSVARGEFCDPVNYDGCSKKRLAPDVQLGMGFMLLAGRGFIVGFEPSFNHSYWKFSSGEIRDSAFTFRSWLGWKFGRPKLK